VAGPAAGPALGSGAQPLPGAVWLLTPRAAAAGRDRTALLGRGAGGVVPEGSPGAQGNAEYLMEQEEQ